MRAISANRRAVREALAHEGWRFAIVGSREELNHHRECCRRLYLPVGDESDNRSRSIREALVAQLPWEVRGQPYPRWLSYISKGARKQLQLHLPLAAEFCLTHGFTFLVGNVWGERMNGRWRTHRTDGPAVVLSDRELYFWRGWQVSERTVLEKPTAERILQEANQTEREVLIQRMGVDAFVKEAELRPVDSFRDSMLLKVDTAEKWTISSGRMDRRAACPRISQGHLPVDAEGIFSARHQKLRAQSKHLNQPCPVHRDWQRDLVKET